FLFFLIYRKNEKTLKNNYYKNILLSMNLINNLLKLFVGDKSKKELQEIRSLVEKVKSFEESLKALSNDELRAKTTYFKEKIKQARATKDEANTQKRLEAEQTEDIDKREDLYLAIDNLEKEAYELSEKALNEILPEAFAVVKETARRFKENTAVEVTASPKDIEFSATKPY